MFRKIISLATRIILLGFQLAFLVVIIYRVVPVPTTPLMIQRSLEVSEIPVVIKKDWVPITQMSPAMALMAVTGEDPQFFDHVGFDFEQIQKSIEKNISKGKTLRGASTISQQTAKNIFLLPIRSFIRKGLEVPLTLMLELFWNKKRILEVYLNIIEMGNGLFGTEAAAQEYYKKPASQLSIQECAAIVTIFPNPRKRNPKKLTSSLKYHQQLIVSLRKYIKKENFWWEKH